MGEGQEEQLSNSMPVLSLVSVPEKGKKVNEDSRETEWQPGDNLFNSLRGGRATAGGHRVQGGGKALPCAAGSDGLQTGEKFQSISRISLKFIGKWGMGITKKPLFGCENFRFFRPKETILSSALEGGLN